MLGNEILLSWYHQGGVRDKINGNLFVKNIHEKVKSKDLYDLFATCGTISSCKVKYNPSGKCKGYGYVQYDSKEHAEAAIAKFNGLQWNETKLEVSHFKTSKDRESSVYRYNNLYVKCIPKKFTNEDLKNLFLQFGDILSAVVIKETSESPENKGFGFVCFKAASEAKNAEAKAKDLKVNDQNLFVCRALSKEQRKNQKREDRLKTFKDCNLYVKELAEDVNDEKLQNAFSQFGKVISARVMLEKKTCDSGKIETRSRGFGFVCFSNKDDARKALQAAPTKEILGKILYVNIAERKEERIAKYMTSGFIPFQPPFAMPMYPPPFYQYPFPRQPKQRHVNFLILDY